MTGEFDGATHGEMHAPRASLTRCGVALCSDECSANGQIIAASAGNYSR